MDEVGETNYLIFHKKITYVVIQNDLLTFNYESRKNFNRLLFLFLTIIAFILQKNSYTGYYRS